MPGKDVIGEVEVKLYDPPDDAISEIRFNRHWNDGKLLCSSWDRSVRLYDVINNRLLAEYMHNGPVLCCDFTSKKHAISGGLDRYIKRVDLQHSKEVVIGSHSNAIRCIRAIDDPAMGNVIWSGGWDGIVKVWDERIATAAFNLNISKPVYSMDVSSTYAIIATNDRQLCIYDVRSPETALYVRDTLMKYQTRCVRFMPNMNHLRQCGFVVSSIEGRVSVDFFGNTHRGEKFEKSESPFKRRYAFKCHRKKDGDNEIICPVSAISFHKRFGTFATGGSDNFVNMWDPIHKKRLCQFHKYPKSIVSLDFSADDSLLAVACSALCEDVNNVTSPISSEYINKNSIFVRNVTEDECRLSVEDEAEK
ncbi:hypothetical protein SNEBB_006753 [Seison nebaliae]|nr:hypothetical protein SNEBB_006753 [Seison nebaliae]